MNKGTGEKALSRVTGSGAFVAAARVVYLVERDKNDEDGETRLFVPIKNNLGNDRMGLTFTVVERRIKPPLQTAPAISWGDETNITADEALAPASRERKNEAAEFLRDFLADGPQPATAVREAGAENGLSWDQIKRAKDKAGVKTSKSGYQGRSVWELAA